MLYDNEFKRPYQSLSSFYQAPSSATVESPGSWQPGSPQPPYYPPDSSWQTPAPESEPKRTGKRTVALIALSLVLLIIFGTGLFAGWEFTNNSRASTTATTTQTTTSSSSQSSSSTASSSNSTQAQQEAAITKVEPAVVQLNVTTNQGQAIGSGVIIDKKGDIVTNNHVVSGEQAINVVLSNGMTEQAQLMGSDAANDLAVVRIQPFTNMTVATIGDASKLTVGQEVLAIGNPLGITETATSGIVSALNRNAAESNNVTLNGLIQTDAPINPGNSGGALVNLQGELIGIPTLTAVDTESNTPANGVGFAISSNTVQTVVAQILRQAGQ